MGKFDKLLNEFIESIPASKLTGFSESSGLIWKNTEFRLDMQGVRMNQRIARHLNLANLNDFRW